MSTRSLLAATMTKRPSWSIIGLSLMVALLHGALLKGWDASSRPEGAGVWHASPTPTVQVRTTEQTTQKHVGREESKASNQGEGPGARAPLRSTADDAASPLNANDSISPLNLPSGPRASTWPPSPAHYLPLEQVDVNPRPVDDEWRLDWSQVPPGTPWRVRLLLWVSADGHIDHIEVLETSPNELWVKRMLAPLEQTELQPGTLAGQAVPVNYPVELAPDQLP